MKPVVLIVHGAGGSPRENWNPWLASELSQLGARVVAPQFPTPEDQTFERWREALGQHFSELGDRPIVVGHSLGVPFLLTMLETSQVRAAFFIAGFTGPIPHKINDSLKSFTYKNFDWIAIKKNCPRFFVFHSDNDPYVPLAKADELAKHLGTDVILVNDAGHFNAAAGYTTFPLLLGKMKEFL